MRVRPRTIFAKTLFQAVVSYTREGICEMCVRLCTFGIAIACKPESLHVGFDETLDAAGGDV